MSNDLEPPSAAAAAAGLISAAACHQAAAMAAALTATLQPALRTGQAAGGGFQWAAAAAAGCSLLQNKRLSSLATNFLQVANDGTSMHVLHQTSHGLRGTAEQSQPSDHDVTRCLVPHKYKQALGLYHTMFCTQGAAPASCWAV